MRTPGVEYPHLPRPHVRFRIAAQKAHARSRHDRNVHAHPLRPVVVRVDVRRGLGAGVEPHEPGASERSPKRGEDLPHVRTAREMGCRSHRPGNAIILGLSVPGDQRQCRIARVPLRMVTPIVGAELLDFRAQAIGINRQWQANEGLRELHVPCDDRRIATIDQIRA